MQNSSRNSRIGRVLAYRRVSTREQGVAGTSLDAQKTEITRYCAAHGFPEPMDYVEVESGGEESEEKRAEVMRLLASIRPGDAVVVSKIDRFARDMVFIVKHVRGIRKKGACFISIAEAFDSRRPESEMMLGAWAMAADMERRRIHERTQGPRKLLRAQGKYVEGGVPFGYCRAADGSRRLVVEPQGAEIVKEMFERSANGWSNVRLHKHLRGEHPGERLFSLTWVAHTLHNPIYTGKISTTAVRPNGHTGSAPLPGDWIDAHEAIISPDLFAIVQRALATRLSGRKPANESGTASFLMRGVARCAICNAAIGCIPRRGRHKSGYYVCNTRLTASRYDKDCPQAPYLRQDTVDVYLARQVGAYLKAIRKALARPPAQVKKPDFEKRRADVRRKRDNILRLVAHGDTTFEHAANILREIETELAEVDAAAAEFDASLTQDTAENRKGALAFVDQVWDEWEALTSDVRRRVLSLLAREITVGKDKQPRIVWKDAGELAVDHAIAAFPVLRAPIVKALPPPRPGVADLLEAALGRTQSRARKAS
jgi:DNA invertase Pin-like site-specific DNA recombinase